MASSLYALLALVVIASFALLLLFSTQAKNQLYIQFILLAFPLLSINILPSGFSFTLFDLLTFFFFLIFYIPKKIQFKNAGIQSILFVALFITLVVSAWNAETFTTDSITAFIQFFSISCFIKMVSEECIANPIFFYKIISILKITLFVSLLFLVGQFIFGTNFSIARSQNSNVSGGLSTRYPSFFQDPQKYAQFLAIISFLFLIKDKFTAKITAINYALLFTTLIAIMFTGGRAAFGGWLVGMFVVTILGNAKHRINIIVVALLLIFVAYNFSENLAMFKRADIDESYQFRLSIWQDAFQIFKQHSLIGIGLGNYASYVALHNPDQYWIAENEITIFDHPESGYLKLLTEMGAIGFVLTMLLFTIPIFNAFVTYLKNKNPNILFLIASLISWLIGFYTVYSLGDNRIRILVATICCLLFSTYQSYDIKNAQHQQQFS